MGRVLSVDGTPASEDVQETETAVTQGKESWVARIYIRSLDGCRGSCQDLDERNDQVVPGTRAVVVFTVCRSEPAPMRPFVAHRGTLERERRKRGSTRGTEGAHRSKTPCRGWLGAPRQVEETNAGWGHV